MYEGNPCGLARLLKEGCACRPPSPRVCRMRIRTGRLPRAAALLLLLAYAAIATLYVYVSLETDDSLATSPPDPEAEPPSPPTDYREWSSDAQRGTRYLEFLTCLRFVDQVWGGVMLALPRPPANLGATCCRSTHL